MTTGVLLLHGFAGMRKEIMPLCEHLEKCGFIVSIPVLSGHESTQKEFANSKYTDWIKSADEAAKELKKCCDRIMIIGFSMGGMIAVNLCQDIEVEKLVFINTPVYYWHMIRMIKNLTNDFRLYFKKYFIAGTNKPLKALLEFQKLLIKTKPLFSDIKCPALIIQTLDDDTVHPKSADFIYKKLNCKKSMKKIETGGHMVFGNEAGVELCKWVLDFVEAE